MTKLPKSGLERSKSGGAAEGVLEDAEILPLRFSSTFGRGSCDETKGLVDQIGLSLRTAYNDVLAQPVPDRFFDLLRQLETAGPRGKKDAQ